MKLYVYSDGACRSGHISGGVHLTDHQDGYNDAVHRYFGKGTNNDAEYRAFIMGVEHVATIRKVTSVVFRLDSQLVAYQVMRKYRCNFPHLKVHLERAWESLALLDVPYRIEWVRRENNTVADAAANMALDERSL